MEIPDVIYADQGLVYGEEIYPTDAEKYHHTRIVEDLKDKLSETVIRLAARNSEIAELKAKLDEAFDALLFYGDKTNYPKPEWFSPIVDDQGQRARTTLEEIE